MSATLSPVPPERTEGISLKLDDLSLQKQFAAYPDELKDLCMWLGWFVREKCGRELPALVERARALSIDMDKTNWSKILRGRWNADAEGNLLTSPVIAQDKLVRYIKRLRESERLAEMAGRIPFVMTPTAQTLWDFIEKKRAPDRINRFGVVVAHTGMQTTATFKEYCREHNHGMCVWMEMPENGSVKEFVVTLASKYSGSKRVSFEQARTTIFETLKPSELNSKQFRTIFIDNAQSGYKEKLGNQQAIFNFIRRVQDETNCCFILKFTRDFTERLNSDTTLKHYFEQFEGRSGGLRNFLVLPDYPPEEDVLAIAQSFKLRDTEKHIGYLTAIARERGRIRQLFEDLQQAKIDAEADSKPLTINYVRAARGED